MLLCANFKLTSKMNPNTTTRLSRYIYFGQSILLIFFGLVTKLFLVDIDMGERFKGFNQQLLTSDILFACAVLFIIIGLLFYLIKRHKNSTLRDRTIIISGILITPMTLLLLITPVLMTLSMGEVGADNSYLIGLLAGLGLLILVILVPLTLLSHALRILFFKINK